METILKRRKYTIAFLVDVSILKNSTWYSNNRPCHKEQFCANVKQMPRTDWLSYWIDKYEILHTLDENILMKMQSDCCLYTINEKNAYALDPIIKSHPRCAGFNIWYHKTIYVCTVLLKIDLDVVGCSVDMVKDNVF